MLPAGAQPRRKLRAAGEGEALPSERGDAPEPQPQPGTLARRSQLYCGAFCSPGAASCPAPACCCGCWPPWAGFLRREKKQPMALLPPPPGGESLRAGKGSPAPRRPAPPASGFPASPVATATFPPAFPFPFPAPARSNHRRRPAEAPARGGAWQRARQRRRQRARGAWGTGGERDSEVCLWSPSLPRPGESSPTPVPGERLRGGGDCSWTQRSSGVKPVSRPEPCAAAAVEVGAKRPVRRVNTNRLILCHVIFLWIRRRGPLGTRDTAVLAPLKGLPQKTRLLASVSEQQSSKWQRSADLCLPLQIVGLPTLGCGSWVRFLAWFSLAGFFFPQRKNPHFFYQTVRSVKNIFPEILQDWTLWLGRNTSKLSLMLCSVPSESMHLLCCGVSHGPHCGYLRPLWSFTWATGKSLLQLLQHLHPLLLFWPCCSQWYSPHFFLLTPLSLSLVRSGFALPQLCFPRGATGVTGGAQPLPTVGLLELSGSGCVRHGTALLPHRDHPCCQHLATYTQFIPTNKTSETFCVKGDIPAVGRERMRSPEMWQSSALPVEQAERLVLLRAPRTAERRKWNQLLRNGC